MIISELKFEKCLNRFPVKYGSRNEYYTPINRARGPHEEIFVLTFKTYGPNYIHLESTSEQIFPVWTEISVNKSFIVHLPK